MRGHAAYRPDIDGLRALAVLPVIAFHMGIQALSGGFIGVDIFFVISGYLIGNRILSDIEQGSFTLADFYIRRVRRIFPALAAMLIVVTAVAFAVKYPIDLVAYGGSLIAATLSYSNIHFWAATDYFNPQAQSAALLHTWSLSVEEQYYLAFPLLMILLSRIRCRLDSAMWAILVASLVGSSIVAFTDPVSAFYLPQHRIWEFLAGTMVLRTPSAVLTKRNVREGAAVLGLLLIFASILFLDPKMAFPGLLALPACLGTALVIAAGGHGPTLTTQILGSKYLRGIGLISYSLYLWHWPTIVFYKELLPVQFLSKVDKGLLGLIILGLSVSSWRFVELPFRQARKSRAVVFGTSGAVAAAIAAIGLVVILAAGFPSRFSPQEQRLAAYVSDRSPPRHDACFGGSRESFADFDPSKCLATDAAAPDVLLFGDSHANHLWLGLSLHSGANILELTTNGCVPTFASLKSDDPLCRDTIRFAREYIPRHRPDLVVLAGRWNRASLESLEQTIDWFVQQKIPVMIVGPIVEYDAQLPKLLALAERRHQSGLWEKHVVRDRPALDRAMSELTRRKGVPYLSPLKTLCPEFPSCRVLTPSGAPVQSDYGHLTSAGSQYLAEKMLHGRPIMELAGHPVAVSAVAKIGNQFGRSGRTATADES